MMTFKVPHIILIMIATCIALYFVDTVALGIYIVYIIFFVIYWWVKYNKEKKLYEQSKRNCKEN